MEMKMKNNYLLIQEVKQVEQKTESGIIIPAEKFNRRARVVNPGDSDVLKKGDIIFKNMGKGTILTLDDIEFEVIHINQIIAVVEDNG